MFGIEFIITGFDSIGIQLEKVIITVKVDDDKLTIQCLLDKLTIQCLLCSFV